MQWTSHVSDPLPALAGLAVMETIEEEQLLERATEMGGYLRKNLESLQQKYEAIGEIRGQGLLIRIDLVKDREPHLELGDITTKRCIELGLSMNIKRRPERGAVWRIAPPLTVSKQELERVRDSRSGAPGEFERTGLEYKLTKNGRPGGRPSGAFNCIRFFSFVVMA